MTSDTTRRRFFYGWVIVGAGMGVQALQTITFGRTFGFYFVLLEREFGWSKAALSFGYSLQQVESGLLGPLQGWLIDRFGPRATMRVGLVVFGAGMMLFSRMNSLGEYYAIFIFMAIGQSLGGFTPLTVTVVNWFRRKRAQALGMMQTGMGIGALLAPAAAWALTKYGWRDTAFASGVLIIVAGLPLAQLMRHNPEAYGYLPDGDRPAPPPAAATTDRATTHPTGATSATTPTNLPGFTVRQALRTNAFWFITLGHASSLLVVSPVMLHLVPHLEESLGFSLGDGGRAIFVLTLGTMAGQLLGGYLGDRISKRLIVTGCMFGHAIAMLLLAYATGWPMVIAFALIHGLSWGMRGPLMTAIRADYFGRASFGTITGFSNLVITAGTVSGPIFAGVMADRLGSYRAAFTILAALTALGSIFWILLRKPAAPAPDRPSVAARGAGTA